MKTLTTSARSFPKGGAHAVAGITALRLAAPSTAFRQSAPEVIPWLDQPVRNPATDVSHYGIPTVQDKSRWHVDITGMVSRPRSVTMASIKAPILLSAGTPERASEAVFWRVDGAKVAIRDNSGVTAP